MNINIKLFSTDSYSCNGNIQGDEMIGRAWAKYLKRHNEVTNVDLNGLGEYDVTIAFIPLIDSGSGFKVLYLQNSFPKPFWNGTIEIFNEHKHKYDGYIFTSQKLMESCSPGLVCQFAVDEEFFKPHKVDNKYNHNVCFVGNNIRDKATTDRYILTAKKHGLVIYGNSEGWNDNCCAGKLPIDDEPILYSSSKICLNAHLKEHLEFGTFNFRIFNILACKGFIISDSSNYLHDEFDGKIVFSDGYDDLDSLIDYYLKNPDKTFPYINSGYDYVLSKHTFKHRINDLVSWLLERV